MCGPRIYDEHHQMSFLSSVLENQLFKNLRNFIGAYEWSYLKATNKNPTLNIVWKEQITKI